MPGCLLSQYSPVNGRSVPLRCVTWYCSGDSAFTAAGFLLYSFPTSPPSVAPSITSSGVQIVPRYTFPRHSTNADRTCSSFGCDEQGLYPRRAGRGFFRLRADGGPRCRNPGLGSVGGSLHP